MAHNQPSTEDISVSVLEIRWSIFSKHFRQFLCSLLVCYKNILCFMWPFLKLQVSSTKMWVFRMSGENLLRHYSRWHLFSNFGDLFYQPLVKFFLLILVIFSIRLWWSFYVRFCWRFFQILGEFLLSYIGNIFTSILGEFWFGLVLIWLWFGWKFGFAFDVLSTSFPASSSRSSWKLNCALHIFSFYIEMFPHIFPSHVLIILYGLFKTSRFNLSILNFTQLHRQTPVLLWDISLWKWN